ncbi:hypothetical protein ACIRQY_07275 [Streptomyces sp. NPDC101490]|uniref:hypothetical protein n=1 Tax=Streptomyces sp. NPDC101490 TaxID=3366143 RepID=UPI0038262796
MSRTAHHASPARARAAADRPPGRPWGAVVLHGLRYDASGAREAAREGRRQRPRAVRRAVEVYAFPRYRGDRTVTREAGVEERRARQRLRRRVGVLRRLVDGPGGRLDLDAAGAADVPEARHRRGALWCA